MIKQIEDGIYTYMIFNESNPTWDFVRLNIANNNKKYAVDIGDKHNYVVLICKNQIPADMFTLNDTRYGKGVVRASNWFGNILNNKVEIGELKLLSNWHRIILEKLDFKYDLYFISRSVTESNWEKIFLRYSVPDANWVWPTDLFLMSKDQSNQENWKTICYSGDISKLSVPQMTLEQYKCRFYLHK